MKKGFSLIEALFVTLTLSLVLGSIFGIAYRAQVSFDEEKRFTETSQHARVATDEITRYIRQAGNDPLKYLKNNHLPAIARGANPAHQIRIRTDITGSYPGRTTGDPDGALASPMEDVTIGFQPGGSTPSGGRYPGTVYLIDNVMGGGAQVLADNIDKFGFLFQDAAGGTPATDADIAAVDILMVAQAPQRGANRISQVRYRSHVFVRSKTFDVFAVQ